MCGIVGGLNIKNIDEFLKEVWDILKVRGEDGFGVAFFNDNFEYIYFKDIKKDVVLNSILKEKEKVKKFSYFLAHNRKASLGSSISYNLTHPIVYGSTLLVHNGTRSVLKEMFEMESDTISIAYILEEIELKTHVNFLNKLLNFSGNIVGLKTSERLYFFKKDKTRSLYFSSKEKIFSSLPILEGMKKVKNISFTIKNSFEEILNIIENHQIENKNTQFENFSLYDENIFSIGKTWKA